MVRKTPALIIGLLLAFGAASQAQASCSRGVLELLKFALQNVQSNFSAIRGPHSGGSEYDLTPAAEQFCPNHFILKNWPADNDDPERWLLKFDQSASGTDDEVATRIIKDFDPVLKAASYRLTYTGPYEMDGEEVGSKLVWTGPSAAGVEVDTFSDDDHPGTIDYEVEVWHDVK